MMHIRAQCHRRCVSGEASSGAGDVHRRCVSDVHWMCTAGEVSTGGVSPVAMDVAAEIATGGVSPVAMGVTD